MLSLIPGQNLHSSSMQNLQSIDEEEESFKDKLKRTFSSIKRRKKRVQETNANLLTPTRAHQPLRAVRSNPIPCTYLHESTPASDLTVRRDVFSRRHYGSVELLNSVDSGEFRQSAGRFRVETGEREGEEVMMSSPLNSPIHLENPEFQTRWYFKYFLGKLHQNYVGTDSEKEPFLLSVVVTDANNHNVLQYRAILWRKTGAKKVCLPYNPNKPQTVKGILGHFDLNKTEKGPKEIFDSEVQKELLVLEEQEGSVNFKFGVVYAKDAQTSDEEFYSNEDGSEAFDQFILLLGERVRLKGWEKYKAGLDVKSNSTGLDSIYTVYEGHEIMFHISTLLPHSKENKQQVERKRHIGNDIVNIVFYEVASEQNFTFKPSMMKTRFTHIFAFVIYNIEDKSYRLQVFSEESVPLFGPPLPTPPVFYDHQEFRDFLLVKLINGEKAAVNNPVFAQKRERTLEMLIKNMQEEYITEMNKNNIYRRAFSDVIQDSHSSRNKEEARRAEFVRVGQTLKLKTILKGNAPTSLVTTGLLKREPWEPQEYHNDFPYNIITGDSWGDKLVVATEAGTMVLEEGLTPRVILDKTVIVKQLSVVELHGLLILRTDKGRDGKIHVFRLTDFEGEYNESIVRAKNDCREHKMEKTKGCHLYALSRPGSSHLRMVVAIQKRLLLFTWKHSAAWSAWCPTIDFDIIEGFNFVRVRLLRPLVVLNWDGLSCHKTRFNTLLDLFCPAPVQSPDNTTIGLIYTFELQAFEVPQLITLIDGNHDDNQICVGSRNQFDLINEKNGDTLQLYHIDANKVNLVSAIDIYEDEESELLLSYNYVSHFQKLTEETSHDFDFHWNSEPQAIVCAFPYVIAFTPVTIEIRLIINGNLVHTMTMPEVNLITSKSDIYFASVVGPSHSPFEKKENDNSFSPPPSPSSKSKESTQCIYKIPLSCLAGHMTAVEKSPHGQQTSHSATLLAPLVNGEKSPGVRRSPLLRTKCIPNVEREKDRHDSSSSDSGITILRPNDNSSPPQSPYQKSLSQDYPEQETDLI